MDVLSDILEHDNYDKSMYNPSENMNGSRERETTVHVGNEEKPPNYSSEPMNLLKIAHCLPVPIERETLKNTASDNSVAYFPFRLSKCFPFNFPSLLDEDGYISFPSLPVKCISFLPGDLQHYVLITSPSFIPSFLFIFVLLLLTFESVLFALTLSLPVALSLCYLEPNANSSNTLNDITLKDKAKEEEVCTIVT